MFKLFFLLVTVVFLLSCNNSNSNKQTSGKAAKSLLDTTTMFGKAATDVSVQTKTFLEVDSSGILMFPLSFGEANSESSVFYSKSGSAKIWNIVFYNSNTAQYHLLGNKKMIFHNLEAAYNADTTVKLAFQKDYIFYEVIADDFNNDGKLTEEDPRYLFLSDKAGLGFKQVSPAGTNLINWKYIGATRKIVMSVLKDTDKNKKFDDLDAVFSYVLEPRVDSAANPTFSNDFSTMLKTNFLDNWGKKKTK